VYDTSTHKYEIRNAIAQTIQLEKFSDTGKTDGRSANGFFELKMSLNTESDLSFVHTTLYTRARARARTYIHKEL
jgi:hypothetical protein